MAHSLRRLVVLLLVLLLAGCSVETEQQEASVGNPNSWGQAKDIGPSWVDKFPYAVLYLPATELEVPEVMTVNLGFDLLGQFADLNGFRWLVKVGAGGAQKQWLIDAMPQQQISLPAQSVEVSVLVESFNVGAFFIDPGVSARASAFVALGNTSTTPAHYTQGVVLGAAGDPNASLLLPYPSGATGFRIASKSPGGGAVNSLFDADVSVSIVASGGASVVATYQGDELFPLAQGDGYIPLPGGADAIIISNATVGQGRSGAIVWEMDM